MGGIEPKAVLDSGVINDAAGHLAGIQWPTIVFILIVLVVIAIPIYKYIFSRTSSKKNIKTICPPETIKAMNDINNSISAINAKLDGIQSMLKDAVLETAEISGSLKALIEVNRK